MAILKKHKQEPANTQAKQSYELRTVYSQDCPSLSPD